LAALNPLLRSVVLLALVAAVTGLPFTTVAQAQTTPPATLVPDLSVRTVRFAQVRPPGGGDAWLEATVDLDVRGTQGAGVYARHVDRVQVAFALSIRRRDGGFDFFRSSAEAVSLEAGPARYRFYLPPEILKREQLGSEPVAWLAELAVAGRPLPAGTGLSAAVLQADEAMRSFKDRVARAAPLNDGVLVPQYESPFASHYGGDTPSFVRRGR
jgi:hypothetical protein